MARSSDVDAVEKFRFGIFVFNQGFDPVNLLSTFTGFLRGGFSEATLPRQTTTVMEYRENADNTHPQYSPGITRYEPIALRRGVTTSSDFYRWANKVHDAGSIVSTAISRIKGDASETAPPEDENFRRDILILVYGKGGGENLANRTTNKIPVLGGVTGALSGAGLNLTGLGDVKKGFYIRDAWVSSFSAGDRLSADEDTQKLIEEIELRYESFEELTPEALASRFGGDIAAAAVSAVTNIF